MYSDEYLQKVARDILVVQLVALIIFVSCLFLIALEGRIRMRVHGPQEINFLEVGDGGHPPAGANSLKMTISSFEYPIRMFFRHRKTKP